MAGIRPDVHRHVRTQGGLQSGLPRTLNPQPQTITPLNPKPSNFKSSPSTPNTQHSTLDPLNLHPSTPKHQPQTSNACRCCSRCAASTRLSTAAASSVHPQLSIRNPQPSTLNPTPSTINHSPTSILSPQPSKLNPKPPTLQLNHAPCALSSQPSSVSHEHRTLDPQRFTLGQGSSGGRVRTSTASPWATSRSAPRSPFLKAQ